MSFMQRHVIIVNYVAKLLWEWKPRFTVALVVRGLFIVTSHTNCDITSYPVVMRLLRKHRWGQKAEQYVENASLPCFFKYGDRDRIAIDHLYPLGWSGWYCYLAQHELFRPSHNESSPIVRNCVITPLTNHNYLTMWVELLIYSKSFGEWMSNFTYISVLVITYRKKESMLVKKSPVGILHLCRRCG